jgi:hypothetical protein
MAAAQSAGPPSKQESLPGEIREQLEMGDDYSLRGVAFDICKRCEGILRNSETGEAWVGQQACECCKCVLCNTWYNTDYDVIPEPSEDMCMDCSAKEPRSTYQAGPPEQTLKILRDCMQKYGDPNGDLRRELSQVISQEYTWCGLCQCTMLMPDGTPCGTRRSDEDDEDACRCGPCPQCRGWVNFDRGVDTCECEEEGVDAGEEDEEAAGEEDAGEEAAVVDAVATEATAEAGGEPAAKRSRSS